jgi:hypothetical protein
MPDQKVASDYSNHGCALRLLFMIHVLFVLKIIPLSSGSQRLKAGETCHRDKD